MNRIGDIPQKDEDAIPNVRRGMIIVGKLLDRGQLSPEAIVENLAFARRVRDDPHANPRQKMRAAELVQKITQYIIDKAIEVEKIEQGLQDGNIVGAQIRIIVQQASPEDPR